MGKTNSAIDDFSKILQLKPGFEKALLQRAKLYIGNGEFELARKDILEHKINEEVKNLVKNPTL